MCFRKIPVSKYCGKERGKHDIVSNLLFLTALQVFKRAPYGVSEILRYWKLFCIKGGDHDFLPSYIFSVISP